MKHTWKWILGVMLMLAVMFALPFLWRTFFGFDYSYHGMMDGSYSNWGHPMMGGWGVSGLFMGFGMLLIWAIPLGLLFLVIYGAVRLANRPNSPTAAQSCSNCGKTFQPD